MNCYERRRVEDFFTLAGYADCEFDPVLQNFVFL